MRPGQRTRPWKLKDQAQEPRVSPQKSVNREVFEGSDLIALRLRAAKKPLIINLLEIPPEEIDLEPVTLEPVLLNDLEVIPIEPMIVPASDILPLDEADDQPASAPAPSPKNKMDGKDLPIFGVGWAKGHSKPTST